MSIGFDNVTMDEAVETAYGYIERGEKCRVVTPNAEIGLDCLKDPALNRLVNDSELVLPDGVGVVYAAKIQKKPLKGKVAGVEFGEKLAERLQNTGESLFLFGGKPGVAQTAADNLKKKYPALEIAGTQNGYFDNEDEIIEIINNAHPDAVYVCLGCPKQEFFMERNRDRLTASLMAGLGGSLDIYSGNSQRAPDFFVRFGLEWFYRLIKEPKRIKRMARLPLYLIRAMGYKGKEEENA